MTPCGMNHVTPTMIRNGQMNIGDKIIFEDEIPVGAVVSASADIPSARPTDILSESPSKNDVQNMSLSLNEAADKTAEVSPVSAPSPVADTSEAVSEVSAASTLAGDESEALIVSADAEDTETVETAAITQLSEAVSDTSSLQPLAYGRGNVERAGSSAQSAQNIQTDSDVRLSISDHNLQTPPPNWPNRPDPVYYEGENRNFITYPRMTDYFQNSVNTGGTSDTPDFTVPSNPMTPPEYTQTLDYDSVQYMNGFLRTQIGRFVRIEQLVGSNTIEDREGFLVGASNNYVILQEIGTGNIMTFDLFSIKFVYIYYEDIPRPSIGS